MKTKIQLFLPVILALVSFQFFIANEIALQWVGLLGFVITIVLGLLTIRQAKGWLKLIPSVTLVGVIVYLSLYGLLIVIMGSGG